MDSQHAGMDDIAADLVAGMVEQDDVVVAGIMMSRPSPMAPAEAGHRALCFPAVRADRSVGVCRVGSPSGYRSAIAASILANHGMTEIADLVGGLAAWEEMGLDLVGPDMT